MAAVGVFCSKSIAGFGTSRQRADARMYAYSAHHGHAACLVDRAVRRRVGSQSCDARFLKEFDRLELRFSGSCQSCR